MMTGSITQFFRFLLFPFIFLDLLKSQIVLNYSLSPGCMHLVFRSEAVARFIVGIVLK